MMRRKGLLWLLFLSCLPYLIPAAHVRAEEAKGQPQAVAVKGKDAAPEAAKAVPESPKEEVKDAVPSKGGAKGNKSKAADAGDNIASSEKRTVEQEQDIMEKALDLLNSSQEYWEKGDIENALDFLDQAYSILLETNGDIDISRQKDDLRLLISKRVLAIYTSKRTVTDGKRSEIPVIMNAEVEKEIRSFQTIEKDFFISAYQRSFFFRPVIVDALKKAGLPEELSWLPLVESGFKIRALSRARALGLWQFIPSTGYKYGLSRDEWTDERMDVEKSTQAAIGYLKELHEMFGDWLTVLAAYNCGEGRVLRVISGQHINYLDRFWDLYNQLPNETARYVPRFLATLKIIREPQQYGFDLENLPDRQTAYAYEKVKTEKTMNLQDIASRIDVSEELLGTLNAELRYKKTPDKSYNLKVPPEAAAKLSAIMDEIPLAEKPRYASSRGITTLRHRVKAGETLSGIARRYRTTTKAIKSYNRSLSNRGLRAGQTLVVPVSSSRYRSLSSNSGSSAGKGNNSSRITGYVVKKGDTLTSIADRFDINVSEIRKINGLKGDILKIGQRLKLNHTNIADSGGDGDTGRKTYRVKKGDSLSAIAEKSGSNVEKLLELNNLKDKNSLIPGQVIVVK